MQTDVAAKNYAVPKAIKYPFLFSPGNLTYSSYLILRTGSQHPYTSPQEDNSTFIASPICSPPASPIQDCTNFAFFIVPFSLIIQTVPFGESRSLALNQLTDSGSEKPLSKIEMGSLHRNFIGTEAFCYICDSHLRVYGIRRVYATHKTGN